MVKALITGGARPQRLRKLVLRVGRADKRMLHVGSSINDIL